MDMPPSQPPHTPRKAASPIIIDLRTPSPPSILLSPSTPQHQSPSKAAPRIIIDLRTPSPPSILLPPSTPQHQTVPRTPNSTYSAPSTNNRTPWWLNTPSESQSMGDSQNRSGSQKRIPAFTADQKDYITRLSRQGLALKKIQEGFDAQFPGNQKGAWEISRIRKAAITIKKGEAVWEVEDGTKLSKRMAQQAEARKRTKARKEDFAAVVSGERPFLKLIDSLMKKEEDREIITSENALEVDNAVEDSPLPKRGKQDRYMWGRESPTMGRGNRDDSKAKGLLAELRAGSDEDDDEQEIMVCEEDKDEGGVLIPPKASLDIVSMQSRTLTAIPHHGRSRTSYPRHAQHDMGVEIRPRQRMEEDVEVIRDAETLNSKLDGHRRVTR